MMYLLYMTVGIVVGILAKVEFDAHKRKQRKKLRSSLVKYNDENCDEILMSLKTINSKLEVLNQRKIQKG